MSNPVATIGNSIPGPGDPMVVRDTFWRINYSEETFFTYAEDINDFDPTGLGDRFYMFVPMSEVATKPSFVSNQSWDGLQHAPSGFVTARYSIMPRIIIPSLTLVDNGIKYVGKNCEAVFNWKLSTLNGVSMGGDTPTDFIKYAHVSMPPKFISLFAKDDAAPGGTNTAIIDLASPVSAPTGDFDNIDLVVGGAFTLMLNMIVSKTAAASVSDSDANAPNVTLEFGNPLGSIQMIVSPSGNTVITVANGSAINKQTVNLAEGKSKTGPVQQQHIHDHEPFIITIYPCWNGLIVSSGVQDAKATVMSSSYYVSKVQDASIMNQPYSSGFDPLNPQDVLVRVEDTAMDFGTQLRLTVKNCKVDVAYLPSFFAKTCQFDEWFLESKDTGSVSYEYDVYAIWTKGGTSSVLGSHDPVTDSVEGPLPDTVYAKIPWDIQGDASKYGRSAAEIFGSIMRTRETNHMAIKNGNGSFNISGASGWADYIQSIQVTTTIDGSSGSITVDKYGATAGDQDFPVPQSVGALTIYASGGNNTVAGSIWQGLALGIGDARDGDGATWTIPLQGLELKLDDILLINCPFFDGYSLSDTLNFLCKYAGINFNMGAANGGVHLGISSDVNVPRFDWKSGTSVKQALDDVMQDTLHNYVVRDGVIYFYALGDDGLPISLGPDRSGGYTDFKMMSYDATPDFGDLRNEIVILGLQAVPEGRGTDISQVPMFPRFSTQSNTTTPDIPWAKTMVKGFPGYLDDAKLATLATKIAAMSSVYMLTGTTTIPGNALIKPYDRWSGNLIIYSVTHNLNFESKSWTTTLEFMKKGKSL